MSEIIILVEKLPTGCNTCGFILIRKVWAECKWSGATCEYDKIPIYRDVFCPLRLRSRYVELPEGWEVNGEGEKELIDRHREPEGIVTYYGEYRIPIKRVEVEG